MPTTMQMAVFGTSQRPKTMQDCVAAAPTSPCHPQQTPGFRFFLGVRRQWRSPCNPPPPKGAGHVESNQNQSESATNCFSNGWAATLSGPPNTSKYQESLQVPFGPPQPRHSSWGAGLRNTPAISRNRVPTSARKICECLGNLACGCAG